MDTSATQNAPSLLRTQAALVLRSGGNPNHGADGRFASGGGGERPSESADRIPAHAPGQHISEHGETPKPIADQCSNCNKIRSSWHPLAGQRVPDDPSEARSHGGYCPECHMDALKWLYLPYLLENQHMSQGEAMAVLQQLVASSQHQFELEDAKKAQQYHQWLREQSPDTERMQRLRRLAAQLHAIHVDLRRIA